MKLYPLGVLAIALTISMGFGTVTQAGAAEAAGLDYGAGSSSIVVNMVGLACGKNKSRGDLVSAALADAREKGREYAVSAIESKTTVEKGVPGRELMNAYARGTIRELATPIDSCYRDKKQGQCCEVEARLEALPKGDELARVAAKISPDNPNGPLMVQVWTDQKIYKEGEKFKVFVKANKSFYGTVVYQDASGAKLQLLPNPYRANNFFAGNTLYELPGPEDKYDLVVTPPLGGEKITVYASNTPLGELSTEPAGKVFLVTGNQEENGVRTRSIRFAPREKRAGKPSAAEFFEATTELITAR
jgi:hypothetical protein